MFFPHVRLTDDAQGATDWGTNLKGFFQAAGVGCSITGMGAFVAVIDDPLKDGSSIQGDPGGSLGVVYVRACDSPGSRRPGGPDAHALAPG
ncbi:hypothetical protein HNQ08_004322 [Deinococcus humi]|uniref:Uncharacterized protein n=1 Tax=Deinococcus humi TaxID=662880 RepID=A0A7W8K0H7_9DEIO|nr:hypothetical protein [Deinococcus humi]